MCIAVTVPDLPAAGAAAQQLEIAREGQMAQFVQFSDRLSGQNWLGAKLLRIAINDDRERG